MQTLGTTLAHGLAARHGREGIAKLKVRAERIAFIRQRLPGKQSRQATFRRLSKDMQDLYGAEGTLFTLAFGQRKDRGIIYVLVEPHDDGSHTIFLTLLTARKLDPVMLNLMHLDQHATARLMQATRTHSPIAALRGLRPVLLSLMHCNLADTGYRHFVLVAPGIGWMPALLDEGTGMVGVRTVITEAALTPWKQRLLQRSLEERRFCLIDTRPAAEIESDIGNNLKALVLGPRQRDSDDPPTPAAACAGASH